MGALFCFVFWHEKETHLTVWRLELKWLRTVAENTVRLEESQEVTRQIGEWFNKAGWKKTKAERVLYLLYWWNFTLAGQ